MRKQLMRKKNVQMSFLCADEYECPKCECEPQDCECPECECENVNILRI